MKQRFTKLIALCLTFSMLFCVGCKDKDGDDTSENLTFSAAGEMLLNEDTKARVFFNNLEYNYSLHDDYEELYEAISYIKTLGVNLSEQFSEYEKTIDAFAGELETSNTKITRDKTTIKIENDTQLFEINMDEEGKNLKINFNDNYGYYVCEIIMVNENSYYCQVAKKGEDQNYIIYQYRFDGSRGKFGIKKDTKYTSIYMVSLNETNYPSSCDLLFEL